MKNPGQENSISDFFNKCRKVGLSVTPQRLAIYKAVIGDTTHPSPETIFKRIIPEFPTISFATVYKTLETFDKNRIISRVTTLHNTVRYDPITERHHHIICVKCKKVIDLKNTKLDSLPVPSEVLGDNQLIDFSVHFNVICAECRRQN